MQRSANVIDDQQLAPRVLAEADNAVSRIGQFAVINDPAVVKPEAPELARVVVAVDMNPVQFLQLRSVVGQPFCDR